MCFTRRRELHPLVWYDAGFRAGETAEALSNRIFWNCHRGRADRLPASTELAKQKKMMPKMYSEPDLETSSGCAARSILATFESEQDVSASAIVREKARRECPHPLGNAGSRSDSEWTPAFCNATATTLKRHVSRDCDGEVCSNAVASDVVAGVQPRLVWRREASRNCKSVAVGERAGLAAIRGGGGTKLERGNRPARADVILSTARLHRVIEHAWRT